METQQVEHNILIAERQPPGDNWKLVNGDETVYSSITDVLEAYFEKTGDKCNFRLEPLNSKLFAIKSTDEPLPPPPPPKRYNIYGDPE